jgi:hypothetical protein
MGVSPTAFAAPSRKKTLAGFCEVEKQFLILGIYDLRPDRHPHNRVLTGFPMSVRPLAMLAALGLMLGIVPKVEECVQTLVRLEPDAASDAAIAAGRAAPRDEFLAAERSDAVSAVPGLDPYFGSVDKHFRFLILDFGFWIGKAGKRIRRARRSDARLKIRKRRTRRGQDDASIFSDQTPKCLKRNAILTCTRSNRDLYTEESLRGVFSGQHPI